MVLARVLDDPTLNVLNSFILFNQIDIINHIQQDESILKELFDLFTENSLEQDSVKSSGKGKEKETVNGMSSTIASSSSHDTTTSDETTTPARKEDVILLIHQLCMMGKNIQIPARLALYRTLVDKGLLYALQWAFGLVEDQQMLNAAGEVLLIVVDHDVNGVRNHVLRQAELPEEDRSKPKMGLSDPSSLSRRPRNETTLLTVVVKLLSSAKDLALRSQMAESLRSLLELPAGDDTVSLWLLPLGVILIINLYRDPIKPPECAKIPPLKNSFNTFTTSALLLFIAPSLTYLSPKM